MNERLIYRCWFPVNGRFFVVRSGMLMIGVKLVLSVTDLTSDRPLNGSDLLLGEFS